MIKESGYPYCSIIPLITEHFFHSHSAFSKQQLIPDHSGCNRTSIASNAITQSFNTVLRSLKTIYRQWYRFFAPHHNHHGGVYWTSVHNSSSLCTQIAADTCTNVLATFCILYIVYKKRLGNKTSAWVLHHPCISLVRNRTEYTSVVFNKAITQWQVQVGEDWQTYSEVNAILSTTLNIVIWYFKLWVIVI